MRALIRVLVLLVVGTVACSHAPYARHDEAIERAAAWLGRVDVDPVALAGQKGKKHYVELLDAYRFIARACRDRGGVECTPSRALALARFASDARYHDMAEVNDTVFHQDATSYLRAAVLLEGFGVDVHDYVDHIRAVTPRLNAQMRLRGANQQMVFAWYYEHFGLAQPFVLAAAVEDGVMRNRTEVAKLTRLDRYDLTHEIFALSHYGEIEPALTTADRAYLAKALPAILDESIAANDVDLAAEITWCLVITHSGSDDDVDRAAAFIAAAQHDDGGFGGPALFDALHTTGVAVGALVLVDEARAPPHG